MKRVFIVGSPRSGSTWTGFLLSHHPRVVTLHHAVLFPYLLALEQWLQAKKSCYVTSASAALPLPRDSQAEPMRLQDIVSTDDIREIEREVAGRVLDSVAGVAPNSTVVVDKTPENVRIAGEIHEILPDAYFMHVVRDPRSVFSSQRAASKGWAGGEFPSDPCDGAQLWRRDVEAGMRIADLTDRYLQVRYEDLLEDGVAELERTFEWLGIPTTADFCRQALEVNSKSRMRQAKQLPSDFVRRTPQSGWRDELSRSQVRIVEYINGDLMEALGYSPTYPVGKKPLGVTKHEISARISSVFSRVLGKVERKAHRILMGRNQRWAPKLYVGPES